MKLEKVIYNMTKQIELDTIEWVFRAIEKTRKEVPNVRKEVKKRLNEQYGEKQTRDKIYAQSSVFKQVVDEFIGENVFKVGQFYIDRGVNRDSRSDRVVYDVNKDYDNKREVLKRKILKLTNNEKIIKFNNIDVESDGKLGCSIVLESKDTIKIHTITAGGWNIQKFHFRGLAKRIKG